MSFIQLTVSGGSWRLLRVLRNCNYKDSLLVYDCLSVDIHTITRLQSLCNPAGKHQCLGLSILVLYIYKACFSTALVR